MKSQARGALAVLLLLCAEAMAQTAPGNSGWTGTLGAGPLFVPRYSGGRSMQTLPLAIAYVAYNDWFYVDLFRAGAYVWASENRKQGVAFSLEPRLGFTSNDGSRLAGMAARRSAAYGGPTFNAEGDWGAVSLGYFADLSNTSRGGYFDALYARELVKRDRWNLTGSVQLTSLGSKVTNYYYGVRPGEVTASRPLYAPGGATNGTLWLTGQYDLNRQAVIMFGGNVTRLGNAAAASPIVERREVPLLYLGIGMHL